LCNNLKKVLSSVSHIAYFHTAMTHHWSAMLKTTHRSHFQCFRSHGSPYR